MATYTLFDAGKRERAVKESGLQAQAADLGVQLTKAKKAAEVTTSYFQLERSRELYQLTRRLASDTRAVKASYVVDNLESDLEHARMEADLFRAELQYRQAYAHVKSLMGDK